MSFNIKITAKKWVIELGTLLGIAGFTYAIDTIIPDLQVGYPEYAWILIMASPFVAAAINWLKHRNDP